MRAVDSKLVVQVGAGGQPTHADITDGLSLLYAGAVANTSAKFRHMGIEGSVFSTVLHDDGVAVAALFATEDDLSITGSLNRCTGGGGVIDPAVWTFLSQYGMVALALEFGGDAAKIYRAAQECLAHTLPIGRVVLAVTFGIGE